MTRTRLVYVGHSHHVQTGSSQFFVDLLQQHFDVVRIDDESWIPGRPPLKAEVINAHEPDIVVFWQLVLRHRELRRLKCRNVVWAPMHDQVNYRKAWRYRRYAASGMKSLHFSAATESFFSGIGFETLRVRYFPAPGAAVAPSEGTPSVFFWTRRKEISWELLKALLGDWRPGHIVVRYAPDPGYEASPPHATDVRDYDIRLHEGWLPSAVYRKLVRSSEIFMAPRLLEGIGLATLEAMAEGCAVVAPDAPTMNEYIRHGETGYLYDPARPTALDFSRCREVGLAAQREVERGHREWLQSQDSVVDFVKRPPASRETALWRLYRRVGL